MKTELMTTLDNGGTPFAIQTNEFEDGSKLAAICVQKEWISYEKFFDGFHDADSENSAALFLTESKDGEFHYLFIGIEAYRFTTKEEITEFYAPIGNSAVPYPVAVSPDNIYFMLDKSCIGRSEFGDFSDWKNAYDLYYGHDDQKVLSEVEKWKMNNVIQLTPRILHPESETQSELMDLVHGLVAEGNFKSEKAKHFKKEAEKLLKASSVDTAGCIVCGNKR